MLIRVLSDIHGNLSALKAVLEDPAGLKADNTICLGDTLGYGSHPVECMNIVRKECDEVLAGNHDLGAAGLISVSNFNSDGQSAIEWTRTQIDQTGLNWLKSLSLQSFYYGISLSHASVVNPASWIYILNSSTALDAIIASGEFLSVYGHTHIPMQWDRMGNCSCEPVGTIPEIALVNCGSVGQPRDGDPRAAYLLLNTDEQTFKHVRVSYDINAAAAAIRAAGLPDYLAGRLYLGK
jgi:diadenosine tetraphosphatase ApaH/serine/threonine PP2A family protein phosphatase